MANEVHYLKHLLSEAGSNGDIVPSDAVENIYEGIYVGVGGTVVLVNLSGNTQTFLNVPNAYIIPVRTRFINATGTTATNMIGL